MPNARDAALQILRRWEVLSDPPFLPERGDAKWVTLPAKERPFAFDLLAGVMALARALDAVIQSQLRQSIETLETPVRAILWIGAYQLLFQENTAAYAAVDTSVLLAKQNVPKTANLVNAVLRGITRLVPKREPIMKGVAGVTSAMRLSRRALSLDFDTELRFNKDIFPDPVKAPISHLAAVRSHPMVFVERLKKIFAAEKDWVSCAADLMLRNNQRPQLTLRVDVATLEVNAAAGLEAHGGTERFLIAARGWNEPLEKLVETGKLSPQDPTAAKPIRTLSRLVTEGKLPAPTKILDLCAGLGTKSLQVARAFKDAAVTATDIEPDKLARLVTRAQQAKQTNIKTVALGELPATETFDVVLVDTPCSNTGVFSKRVQSRWRWPILDHPALATLQMKLLTQGASLASEKGCVIYATCSIDPEENQKLVAEFIKGKPEFKIVYEEITLPSLETPSPHDGGYFTILAR